MKGGIFIPKALGYLEVRERLDHARSLDVQRCHDGVGGPTEFCRAWWKVGRVRCHLSLHRQNTQRVQGALHCVLTIALGLLFHGVAEDAEAQRG